MSKEKLGFEQELVRLPGQSVDEEIKDFFEEKVDFLFFQIGILFFLIIFSVIVWYTKPINPLFVILTCIPFIGYSIYKLTKAKSQLENLRRGRDGERYVGQLLEDLRKDGYRIFHDIFADNFNLDHVVIGKTGIYVIETKTWGNSASIKSASYDGRTLNLNGYAVPRNPIFQVQAEARWLSDILRKSIGNKFYVQPIIALPSKFIDPLVNKVLEPENVRLLNPKTIARFLNNDAEKLTVEQINQVSLHLERIIKSQNSLK